MQMAIHKVRYFSKIPSLASFFSVKVVLLLQNSYFQELPLRSCQLECYIYIFKSIVTNQHEVPGVKKTQYRRVLTGFSVSSCLQVILDLKGYRRPIFLLFYP